MPNTSKRPEYTGKIKEGDWVTWWNEVDKEQMYGVVQSIDPVYAVIGVNEDDIELIEKMKEDFGDQEVLKNIAGDEVMFWDADVLVGEMRHFGIKDTDLTVIDRTSKKDIRI